MYKALVRTTLFFCQLFNSFKKRVRSVMQLIIFLLLILIGGCLSASNRDKSEVEVDKVATAFSYVGGHLMVVPVVINNNIKSRFILDTGIGMNLISMKLCQQIGCEIKGSHLGKRMSGQDLKVNFSHLASLKFSNIQEKNASAGIWDLEKLLPRTPEFSNIEGFLSLNFFEKTAFTIDYENKKVIVEDSFSLQKRLDSGIAVPIRRDQDHEALSIFIPIKILNHSLIWVKLDTGSSSLILNSKFMNLLKIHDGKIVDGTDETGNSFSRIFSEIPGSISLSGKPELRQDKPKVIFQNIIHDGLIGDSYLKSFVVTFDLPNLRLILKRF